MNETPQHHPDDVRLRALIDARHRFTFSLSGVVVIIYTLIILLMAFLPDVLAVPVRPRSAVSSGLLASFLFVMLTFAVMGIYVRRRTGDGSGAGHDEGTSPLGK